MSDLRSLASSIKPGDFVLMKYGGMEVPALIFYQIVKWGLERGYVPVVNDVLNSLYIYEQHLKMLGLDTDFMDELYSIKWGGDLKIGKVVNTIPIGSPAVEVMGEYRRSIEELFRDEKIMIVFTGSEKVFIPYSHNIEDVIVILNGILPHLGNERFISFFLLNSDVAEELSKLITMAFEGVATAVVNCKTSVRGGALSVNYEIIKRIG